MFNHKTELIQKGEHNIVATEKKRVQLAQSFFL